MTGPKTNEVPGTRAVLRHFRMSAFKARQVLDLIRGHDVDRAEELLRNTPREAARVVSKVLASAVANAQHNDGLDPEELYVSACYADEGATLKRWRPRARGRASRIRKRTTHITIIVSRLPEDRLQRRRLRAASTGAQRSRRVAASRHDDAGAASAQEVPVPGRPAGSSDDLPATGDDLAATGTAGADDQDEGDTATTPDTAADDATADTAADDAAADTAADDTAADAAADEVDGAGGETPGADEEKD